jgi:hypothetical protein
LLFTINRLFTTIWIQPRVRCFNESLQYI